ncbi:hypothetical protein B0H16DRAFT_1705207 [Mycena metata]|uniref:Uncharacterized protein n=1 Tax=Mycena metata TaxID=1033252 RepID=A0AAD7E0L3_9AGAR|nr:hypothetical protein B0H16DRAFT_1705207 [Mycena metata]
MSSKWPSARPPGPVNFPSVNSSSAMFMQPRVPPTFVLASETISPFSFQLTVWSPASPKFSSTAIAALNSTRPPESCLDHPARLKMLHPESHSLSPLSRPITMPGVPSVYPGFSIYSTRTKGRLAPGGMVGGNFPPPTWQYLLRWNGPTEVLERKNSPNGYSTSRCPESNGTLRSRSNLRRDQLHTPLDGLRYIRGTSFESRVEATEDAYEATAANEVWSTVSAHLIWELRKDCVRNEKDPASQREIQNKWYNAIDCIWRGFIPRYTTWSS